MKNRSKLLAIVLPSVFFFSGFSSLIYQIAWQRILTVHYGVGMISITLIVSIYMFGLGVGALWGGYLAERVKKKLFLYFLVECLIGCFGVISFPLLLFLGRHTAGSSPILSFIYQAVFLCIPTFLMGMTLPLLTKIFNHLIRHFVKTISLLYFINTLGAAVGTLFASYIAISLWGLDTAIYLAAGINFILAGVIFLVDFIKVAHGRERPAALLSESQKNDSYRWAYLFVFITGFLAIGYELIWIRIVTVLVKSSPYAFSTTLFFYLLGIALGSLGIGKYLNRHPGVNRRKVLFSLQFLIGISTAAIIIGYYYLTLYTPFKKLTELSFSIDAHPPLNLLFAVSKQVLGHRPFFVFFSLVDVFFWPMFFVLIPTIFMGGIFPLLSWLALKNDREGQTVGKVYFFNILGNVLGGVVTGFLLLPYAGTELTSLLFSLVGVGFGVWAFTRREKAAFPRKKIIGLCLLALALVILFPKKGQLYAVMHPSPGKQFSRYFEEGLEGIVLTYQKDDVLYNYVNGSPQGGRPGYTFYVQAIEALMYMPKAENILIIGYGTGSTVEAVLKTPHVKRVTLVEINQSLLANLTKMELFEDMLLNPKLKIVVDDGRRFLLRNTEKFDGVFMNISRTTSAYSNNLHSQQFFELIRRNLAPAGVFSLWVDEYRVLPKTLSAVFRYTSLYINPPQGFCLASETPFFSNVSSRALDLLHQFSVSDQEYIRVSRVNFKMLPDDRFQKLTAPVSPNQDWKPWGEYYLGLKMKYTFWRGIEPEK